MPELDVFESRFAAAYRRYLAEAPTEVDAAAVVWTVVAAHPRAHKGAWPWALRPAPALAWLVLLALLLAAIGVAVLFAGSQRPALGFACPAGSTPDKEGPVAQARPPSEFDGMAFDRDSGKVVVTAANETWAFDVCANTWARRQAAPFESGVRLVHDADSDLTIAVEASGTTWAYDLEADTWTRKSTAAWPLVPWVRLAYVPDSGRVLAVATSDPPGLWAYDVDADAWQHIAANVSGLADVGDARFMAWDPSVERIVAYGPNDCTDCAGGDHAILVDPRTGAWTRATAITPDLHRGYYEPGGEIAYDESAQQTVVFVLSRDVMVLIAYDATADRWETLWSSASAMFEERTDTLAPDPGPRLHQWMAYDSMNERIVVAGGERDTGGWMPANDVWAFDTATRQWTELLAPNSP